jgi:hypothetical protein
MSRYVISQTTPVKDYSPVFGYEISRNPGDRTAQTRTLGKSDDMSAAIDMALTWLTDVDPTDVITVTLRPGLPWKRERVVFHARGQRTRDRWSL